MYKRHIESHIAAALEDTPVIVINGARQTGKTTLCKQLVKHQIFDGDYITFDNPALLKAAKDDPLGFLRSRPQHIILDEIQKAPELLICIKQMVDEDRKNRRYILTGSANVMNLPKVSDSLAGRIEIHNLWPLSQSEIKGHKSNFLENLVSDKKFTGHQTPWNDIAYMLESGSYPEALERTNQHRRISWFNAYINSILQRDIKELTNIEGLLEIPNLLSLIAGRAGGLLNFADLSRGAKIPQTTVKRYYSLLLNIFMIVEIPPWTPNLEGRFVKSPKTYLGDTGLLCYLQNINAEHITEYKRDAGSILESFVVMEIVKQLGWSDIALKAYHFRTHKGQEVDLLLEDRNRNIYGIEIKSSETPNNHDFKGLKALQSLMPDKFKKGIVLYTGEHFFGGFGDNMYAVPLSSLWS